MSNNGKNIVFFIPLQEHNIFSSIASPEVLRDLMKFWVGLELLTRNLIVEFVTSTYPVALTCFYKLKLLSHYQTYKMFHQDMMMAISSGFWLVPMKISRCCT